MKIMATEDAEITGHGEKSLFLCNLCGKVIE